jgi:hypothetical protein
MAQGVRCFRAVALVAAISQMSARATVSCSQDRCRNRPAPRAAWQRGVCRPQPDSLSRPGRRPARRGRTAGRQLRLDRNKSVWLCHPTVWRTARRPPESGPHNCRKPRPTRRHRHTGLLSVGWLAQSKGRHLKMVRGVDYSADGACFTRDAQAGTGCPSRELQRVDRLECMPFASATPADAQGSKYKRLLAQAIG